MHLSLGIFFHYLYISYWLVTPLYHMQALCFISHPKKVKVKIKAGLTSLSFMDYSILCFSPKPQDIFHISHVQNISYVALNALWASSFCQNAASLSLTACIVHLWHPILFNLYSWKLIFHLALTYPHLPFSDRFSLYLRPP